MNDYEIRLQLEPVRSFRAAAGETILDAAIRHGIDIAYSCRNGTCRTCIVQVIAGEVAQEEAESCMISAQELEMGRRLICMSTPRSDAVLAKIPPRQSKRTKPDESIGG